jgi:predicted TIM-barrel fold metal-dependent hydrolase
MLKLDYPVIDCHTHVFPPKIAKKAVLAIGDFYGIPMTHTGSMKELCAESKKYGLEKMLITSTATKSEQVTAINDFLKDSQDAHDTLFAFGTLFPGMDDYSMDAEIDRIIQMGLYGVKLHPDFQRVKADSDGMKRIARQVAGRLPVLIHAGDPRYDFSNPDRIRALVESAPPDFTLIAAHFGGYRVWDEAAAKLTGYDNLYVDTCSSLEFLEPARAVELIGLYGEDRVLFGTDYPMWNYDGELARVERLGLSPAVLKKILYSNAKKLFF